MMGAPNAMSHGVTTALAGGLTMAGWVFVRISAAKPVVTIEPSATAVLAARTSVLLIISLLRFVPLAHRFKNSSGSEQQPAPVSGSLRPQIRVYMTALVRRPESPRESATTAT